MALLKEPLSAAQKAVTMRRLQLLAALAVSTQNYNLSSDTQLILSCCGGDSARAAPLIAATSSASGLIEFLLNPGRLLLPRCCRRYRYEPFCWPPSSDRSAFSPRREPC
eukprot:COSAG06_NODE_2020_length_7835_cov_3.118795_1_plen_108_part_10